MTDEPYVEGAPGLVWKKLKSGWEARWRARRDIIRRGFSPASARLWFGTDLPTEQEGQWIRERCVRLQDEMLVFGRGGVVSGEVTYDGTVAGLIRCYQYDQDSTYQSVRYHTRLFYDRLCVRIEKDCGKDRVSDIDVRRVKRLYEGWSAGGKTTMGHACVGMFRTLLTYGAALLKDQACKELKVLLHDIKFKMGAPRSSRLTADQANAIRAKAHEMGLPSIALAQAFQFDLMLRQKDVIGEWIPTSEPGVSDVVWGAEKWGRGLRWNEIDKDLVLRHTTSKRLKDIEVNLKLAPMVMEELAKLPNLPANGPVIVCEKTGVPWSDMTFRFWWRKIARAAGVPDDVRNMDSRAGAITEATEAGVPLEHIKQAATHSDISMTQRYARGAAEKTAEVMKAREAFRNASKTK